MKCKKIEKYLYLLSDGHAKKEQEALAREHLQSCARCSRLFAYLQSMRHGFAGEPLFAAIPEDDVGYMVASGLRRHHRRFQEKPQPLFGLLPAPRLVISFASLLFVAAGILIIPRVLHDGSSRQCGATEAVTQKDQPVCADGRDSILAIGHHCTVRLKKNASCTMVRSEEKVIRIVLQKGTLLLAAKKGFYDTIAVECSGVKVLATGTHFSVEQESHLIKVSVLEGAVKVINEALREIPVAALEECTFTLEENDVAVHRLSVEKQDLLTDDFAYMTAANTRRELAAAAEEAEKGVSSQKAVPGKIIRLAQGPAMPRDSAVQNQYVIAEGLLLKENFGTAAHVFGVFNAGFCYNNLYGRRGKRTSLRKKVT